MRKKILSVLLAGLVATGLTAGGQATAESAKFNMSYLSYGSPDNFTKSVDRTKGALQEVAPDYFGLTADGSLQISKHADSSFVDAMHQRKLKVVPFLSNEWDQAKGRKALQNRQQLSAQIAAAVRQLNLDGVQIDIENLTESDRDELTEFVKILRSQLPAGSELSVAIPANPDGNAKGYAASTDNLRLAEYCDYLMLMAYDEHSIGDPTPGPVASLPFVEKSIRNALTQVPPSKLVLGIPFYGRFWNGIPSFNGTAISNAAVDRVIDTYHGVRTYDETNESAKAQFTIRPNDPPTVVNSKTLPPGNYTVWYETDRSIKAKLEMVEKYHLKGTASWSLSEEPASTWDYYALWLNGHYFTDVQGHWALNAVLAVANRGWMTGLSDAQFGPELPLTRAQAAVILARATGIQAAAPAESGAGAFADVPQNYWAYPEIAAAAKEGFFEGIRDGVFAPDQPLTREQMCVLLSRILSLPAASDPPHFSDVTVSSWSYPAIANLSANHIVDGFEDGTFRPQSFITRAQMAVLMDRIADKLAP